MNAAIEFFDDASFAPPRDSKPTREQPGTLGQQIECIALFLANPYRHVDRKAAWQLARRVVLPHARAA